MIRSFRVRGKVQGVMFRQTFIRACQKRNIDGGATNCWKSDDVLITIEGSEKQLYEIIERLKLNKPINSWNATPVEVIELENIIPISEQEVTCHNVDHFNWTPGVEMYL